MSLDRFLDAQTGLYPAALYEITAGKKRGHWMWFIFPQLAALGRSETALYYGIADLIEATAYAAHPILGPRLHEISAAMLTHGGTAPEAILGPVDALKLRSCATLFDRVRPNSVFADLLAAFYAGESDPLTLAAL